MSFKDGFNSLALNCWLDYAVLYIKPRQIAMGKPPLKIEARPQFDFLAYPYEQLRNLQFAA